MSVLFASTPPAGFLQRTGSLISRCFVDLAGSVALLAAVSLIGVAAPGGEAHAESRTTRSDLFYAPAPPLPVIAVEFVSESRSDQLSERLDESGLDLDAVKAGTLAVPRLYITALPDDLRRLDSSDDRKDVFLGSLLPLVLMANEEILAARHRAEQLYDKQARGEVLTLSERDWLNDLAATYETSVDDRDELLRRVDALPVSLTLAQAIEESGWGTSRYARDGNALFGQKTWSKNTPGLVARKDGQTQDHRARAFGDIMQSVRSYMHNLNTYSGYRKFRAERERMRDAGEPLDGRHLVAFLGRYAESGSYVQNIRRLIDDNELLVYEGALLSSGNLAEVKVGGGDGS